MPTRSQLCDQWLLAKDNLNKAKKQELSLRKKICSEVLKDKKEGTVTYTDLHGYIIEATAKLTRKVMDPKRLAACGPAMTDEEKSVYSWEWVPKINLENFRKYKNLFHVREQIIEKPATPTLGIEKDEHVESEINPPTYSDTTQGMNQQDLDNGTFIPAGGSLEQLIDVVEEQLVPVESEHVSDNKFAEAVLEALSDDNTHSAVPLPDADDEENDAGNFDW